MLSLSPHNALYPLVLNSSLNGVIEQDVAAITAAFHINILVGVSLYRSEAVVAAFPCRAVVVGCSLRWPTAALPPIPHLSQTSVFPLFFIRLTFPCTALVRAWLHFITARVAGCPGCLASAGLHALPTLAISAILIPSYFDLYA